MPRFTTIPNAPKLMTGQFRAPVSTLICMVLLVALTYSRSTRIQLTEDWYAYSAIRGTERNADASVIWELGWGFVRHAFVASK